MLTPQQVIEIQALLHAGELPMREIARRSGVSRGTVQAIADGRRQAAPQWPRNDYMRPDDDVPPRRCAGCGGMVHPPCRLCRVRRLKASGRGPQAEPRSNQRNERPHFRGFYR
ncbi:MAG: helix-turn-helix domain-containing protein [Pirellulales bacterium]|nr:helix-turn-helix domain-containing protein [Pirellulales bacterium]